MLLKRILCLLLFSSLCFVLEIGGSSVRKNSCNDGNGTCMPLYDCQTAWNEKLLTKSVLKNSCEPSEDECDEVDRVCCEEQPIARISQKSI